MQRIDQCAHKRDECNSYRSKICNFFEIKTGLHKGCDAIIVTQKDDKVYFSVCELKSSVIKTRDIIMKFYMAQALITYIFEIAKAFGCSDLSPNIHYILFRISETAIKRPTTYSKRFIQKNYGPFEVKEYAFYEKSQINQRQIRLEYSRLASWEWSLI